MTIRYLILGALCVVAAVFITLLLWPEDLLTGSLECDETAYEVSTGTDDGQCVTEALYERQIKIRCEDGSNYASAECRKGCGESGGAGVCKEVAKQKKPDSTNVDQEQMSKGRLSIRCGDAIYAISTGTGKGLCAMTGPSDRSLPRIRIRCSDGEAFASAECRKGCEKVSGSGSCEVIKPR